MRILKDSRDEPFKQKVKCRQCKSQLQAEAGDVCYQPLTDVEPAFFYVICAVCQNWILLKESQVPESVQKEAEER